MIFDAHVYCLPERLRDGGLVLPETEAYISKSIYGHPEGPQALKLSSPEKIVSSMRNSEIDRSVLISFPWSSQELCRENNGYILEVASKNKCFLGVCSVQPKDKSWVKEAQECFKAGAIGIKVNSAWQDHELDGPQMDDLAEFVRSESKFLMIHVDHIFNKSKASPAHLYSLAKKHPQTRIIAAHMGGLLGLYNLYSPVAQTLSNVWFDTAVSATLEMVRFFVEAGLHSKVIFGSDFPFNHSHSQQQVLKGIKELKLESNVEEAILGGNFLSFLGGASK